MPNQPLSESVAGFGVARTEVPKWISLLRALLAIEFFASIVLGAFALNGWRWLIEGVTSEFAAWCAATVTAAFAISFLFFRLGAFDRWLAIERNGETKTYRGMREPWRIASLAAVEAGLFAACVLLTQMSLATCPLPERLEKTRIAVSPADPAAEGLSPVYFWDYATWIDPRWLEKINLVLPYEKGPPKKLLSKIYFEDAQSKQIVLELHGRRPRAYAANEVNGIFNSSVVHPRDWPLLWRLEKEAGLHITGHRDIPALHLMQLDQGASSATQAIGVPWTKEPTDAGKTAAGNGRAFFWGPEGSVFQIKCPAPCSLSRMLELVQFPPDPRGSHAERLAWTTGFLKKLLIEPTNQKSRAKAETLLSIYLASMLTMDPRDPEAYFHLGKLAHNKETVLSAIRYGKDLGLEQHKILELEAVAEKL